MAEKVKSYEDQKFIREDDTLNSLYQCYEDLKFDLNGRHGWNKLMVDLEGLTMRFVGKDMVEITLHKYEVTTPALLAFREDTGKQFLDEVAKEFKKRFKDKTKKALKMTKKNESITHEKTARFLADNSWVLDGRRSNFGDQCMGEFLIRYTRLYKIEA